MVIKYWRRRSLILNTVMCRLVWGSEIFHLYCREIGNSWRSNKLRRRYCALHQIVSQESRPMWLLEGGSRTSVLYRALCGVYLTLFLDKRFLILSDSLCFGSHKFAAICLPLGLDSCNRWLFVVFLANLVGCAFKPNRSVLVQATFY